MGVGNPLRGIAVGRPVRWTGMRSRRRLHAAAPGAALACALVLADPSTAVAATAASSAGGDAPLGLTALGALLGVAAFGARQWWSRDERSRRP